MIPKFALLTNMVVASFSGFLMNILLFYLIVKKTPTEMRAYGRIMKIHCVSDMFYDLIQTVAGVHANPLGGKGFFTRVDLTVNRYLFDAYFWSLLFSIALLPIDFIFRYLSVCKNRNLSNLQLFAMVFFAYFITFLHAFVVSQTFLQIGPSPESIELTRELQKYPQWTHDVPSFSVTILNSKYLINFAFILSLNSFTYGIICYTFFKIKATLKTNAKTSANSKSVEIQRQVSRILALQATLPMLVICVPVVATVILALARIDMPHFGAYGSAVYVWFSAVKPTATIMIVPRYRNFVRTRLFGLSPSGASVTMTSKSMAVSTVDDSDGHVW